MCCDGRHTHSSIVGEPEDGVFKSAAAEAYPPDMNRLLADFFVSAAAHASPLVAWAMAYPMAHIGLPVSRGGEHDRNSTMPILANGKPSSSDYGNDSPSYRQTLDGPEAPMWRRAREEEVDNLIRHGAVEWVPEDSLPTWSRAKQKAWEVIDTLWVFKRKRDAQGDVCRYKGRCTLRGDQQSAKATQAGQELNSFAPTVRHSTFKLLNATGCIRRARKRTFDVEAAFLQGHRHDLPDVHCRPPPMSSGPPPTDDRGVPLVWKLRRPLYGSADAARIWYQTLDEQLVSQGFTRSEYDPCYYYKVYDDGARTDMSIYVDDSWVSDTSGERCDAELEKLGRAFKLTVKEVPDAFLGMNLSFPDPSVTELSNEAYLKKLAAEYLDKPLESYRHGLPAERSLMDLYATAVRAKEEGGRTDAQLTKRYMSTVGALLYVAPSCRPEVSHCVGILARALTFPTPELLGYAQRVIAWLARRPSEGLKFDGNATDADVLVAYSDSDWGVKQSTTGWCIHLGGAAVAWRSARQHSIAMSSTEAELIAASDAALEILYLRELLAEMGFRQKSPTVLYVDNTGAVELSRDLKSCQRSRHVERRYLKIRELVAASVIEVKAIDTKDNPADLFTKSTLDNEAFTRHAATVKGN